MSDPFRDDENAALIRAAKLEEENAELRRELAAARQPKPPEPKPPPSDQRTLAQTRSVVALSMLMVIIGGAVFALTRRERAHGAEVAARKSVESTPSVGKITPVVQAPDWASQAVPTTVNLRAFTQGHVPAAGYAVGTGGTILRHYENAQSWTVETSGTTSDLAGVAEQVGNVCAVGMGGVATCTDAEQREWHVEQTGTKSDLLGVNTARGFLAVGRGGTIVRRTRGGWRAEPSGITTDLYAVEEPYAVGAGGVILEHKNKWTPIPSGTTEDLFAIDVQQHGVVIVGAHGTVLRLIDPRDGFHAESSGVTVDLFGVSRGDAGYDFIAAGASGTIIRSMNTGGIWRAETSGTSHDLHAVRGSIPTMFIVGDEATVLSHRY